MALFIILLGTAMLVEDLSASVFGGGALVWPFLGLAAIVQGGVYIFKVWDFFIPGN